MARLPDLTFAELSAEQQSVALYGLAASGGQHAPLIGPNSVLIRLPSVSECVRDLTVRMRSERRIENRLFELTVLMVARDWTAQYAWFAHEPGARAAGLSDAVIEAVKQRGAAPPFERDDERLVFELVNELQQTRRLRDSTYARAEAMLGQEKLIELVATIGFYNFLSTVLSAFEVPVPSGQQPPLDES